MPIACLLQVWQHGPRQRWNEVEGAHAGWLMHDRPSPNRFCLTATATGETAWLDNPGQPTSPGSQPTYETPRLCTVPVAHGQDPRPGLTPPPGRQLTRRSTAPAARCLPRWVILYSAVSTQRHAFLGVGENRQKASRSSAAHRARDPVRRAGGRTARATNLAAAPARQHPPARMPKDPGQCRHQPDESLGGAPPLQCGLGAGAGSKERGELVQQKVLSVLVTEDAVAGEGFDAAEVGADRGFGPQPGGADLGSPTYPLASARNGEPSSTS